MRTAAFASWFVPIFIAYVVIVIIYNIHRAKKLKIQQKANEYYEVNRKQYDRGVNAQTLETAKDALMQLEFGFDEVKELVGASSVSCYEDDIQEVRENVEAIALEKWEHEADKILDEFLKLYALITDPCFADVDKAYCAKDKCLAKYDEYWEWTREVQSEGEDCFDTLNLWNEAKEHFRWRFGNETDDDEHELLVWDQPSALSTRQLIEKRLSDCAYTMQPEYKRKMQLRNDIMRNIAQCGTVARSTLMKMRYDGFIDEEVRACYSGLLKERMLIEVKQGSRYFVSLTDKSAKHFKPAQRQAQQQAKEKDDADMIENKSKLIYDAIIQHLKDEGIAFVDKTEKGGGLYFFSEQAAEELKAKGYAVRFTEKGTKGTAHKSAWYLTFKE